MNLNEVSSQQHPCEQCSHNPHYLILNKKTVSRLIALLLLLAFFIFVAGYFLGKKTSAEDFSHHAEHTSFSDQINFALTTLYDKNIQAQGATQENKEASLLENLHTQKNPECPLQQSTIEHVEHNLVKVQSAQQKWVAQLFGGTQKEVTEFVNRLSKKGIVVEIRKRFGKTAKGNKIYWYQAVTQQYDNKQELEFLLEKIKKLEKIKVSRDNIIAVAVEA